MIRNELFNCCPDKELITESSYNPNRSKQPFRLFCQTPTTHNKPWHIIILPRDNEEQPPQPQEHYNNDGNI